METELKSCPFCGGELACGRLRMAACRTDSCYMRNFVIDMDDPGSVARWNRRADLAPTPQDARVKALVGALRAECDYWVKRADADLADQDANERIIDYPIPRKMTEAMRKADALAAALAAFDKDATP